MELERSDIKKSLRNSSITKLNGESVALLRKEIQEKLDIIKSIYGVKLSIGLIQFDEVGFKTTLKAQLETVANGMSGEQAAFVKDGWLYGFGKEHYNAEVLLDKGKFSGMKGNVVAINKRAKKYPVVIKLQNKTAYSLVRITSSYAHRLLGIQK